MKEIGKLLPRAGSYVWETDFSSRIARTLSGAKITRGLAPLRANTIPTASSSFTMASAVFRAK
jgi:hypothetical protein